MSWATRSPPPTRPPRPPTHPPARPPARPPSPHACVHACVQDVEGDALIARPVAELQEVYAELEAMRRLEAESEAGTEAGGPEGLAGAEAWVATAAAADEDDE